MKIIIDIPKQTRHTLNDVNEWKALLLAELREIVNKGTPLPDNATNKDIVKAVFGEESYNRCLQNVSDWWNAPYQKGGKKNG